MLQYFRYENQLVVQNADYNDTFDLSNGTWLNEIPLFDVVNSDEINAALLDEHFNNRKDFVGTYKATYKTTECIIPNQKVTIDYDRERIEGKLIETLLFVVNSRVFAKLRIDFNIYMILDQHVTLTTNQYCKIVFEENEQNRKELNKIINALNFISNYDTFQK